MNMIHSSAAGVQTMGQEEPTWVSCMHAHYGQTGEYRGADVHRLLGDQRIAFDLSTSHSHQMPAHVTENIED